MLIQEEKINTLKDSGQNLGNLSPKDLSEEPTAITCAAMVARVSRISGVSGVGGSSVVLGVAGCAAGCLAWCATVEAAVADRGTVRLRSRRRPARRAILGG